MSSLKGNCYQFISKCLPACFTFKETVSGWKEQNLQQDTNEVYKLVSLKGGGEWIDIVKNDEWTLEQKKAEIARILKNSRYFQPSHSATVFRPLSRPTESNEKKETTKDGRIKLEIETKTEEDEVPAEYIAWDMSRRGGVGETPLHICHLLHAPAKPEYMQLSSILLSIYPDLARDVYAGPEYFGEGALHLAIEKKNYEGVWELLDKNARKLEPNPLVRQRARGRFFLPEDQLSTRRPHKSDYKGYAYYGEFPLSFAASFGFKDIYDLLLEHGAEPNQQDSFGNTVLHMCVIHNRIDMFHHALRVSSASKRPDLYLSNKAGFDPLVLASTLGHAEIFNEILVSHHSKTVWRWGDITCARFNLNSLDTIAAEGQWNTQSALKQITLGKEEGHFAMLDNTVITQLLEKKWEHYGKSVLLLRIAVLIVHLLALSVATWTRPNNLAHLAWPTDPTSITRYVFEAVLVVSSFLHLMHYLFIHLQLWRLVLACWRGDCAGLGTLYKDLLNPKHAISKFLFMLSCALVLFALVFRVIGRYKWETACIAIACPGAWCYLLFYARGYKLFGPFITMIYEMCISDIRRFTIIYTVFLIMFAQPLHFLFKEAELEENRYRWLDGAFMRVFQMTLGEFDYEDFDEPRLEWLGKVVFLAFALLLPILLLNMLIAMMGSTYKHIISRSQKEWKRQWAKLLIMLEQSLAARWLQSRRRLYAEATPIDDAHKAWCIMVIQKSNHFARADPTVEQGKQGETTKETKPSFQTVNNEPAGNKEKEVRRSVSDESQPWSASRPWSGSRSDRGSGFRSPSMLTFEETGEEEISLPTNTTIVSLGDTITSVCI